MAAHVKHMSGINRIVHVGAMVGTTEHYYNLLYYYTKMIANSQHCDDICVATLNHSVFLQVNFSVLGIVVPIMKPTSILNDPASITVGFYCSFTSLRLFYLQDIHTLNHSINHYLSLCLHRIRSITSTR